MIHRDLKPGNLFLTTSADVKLGDFGIARDLQNADITASGMTVGTRAYMAPEQITGAASVSGKADLYSLGCCLFQMLVGRTPFVGADQVQLFEQHLRSDPPRVRDFVSSCPAALDEIVDKLLAKNPDDRPFNARQVQAVMLRLGETKLADLESTSATVIQSNGCSSDVGGDDVASRGRAILQEQIEQRMAGAAAADVSWGKLAVMLAAIAGVIAAAAIWRG